MPRTIQEDFREFLYLDCRRVADGLSTTEFERWQILHHRLNSAFSSAPPSRGAERRRSLRLPTRLRVVYDGLQGHRGTVVNLSRAGCFVRTKVPAPVGTRLRLILEISNLPDELEIDAEVVSTNYRSNQSGRGMGLRFVDMEPDTRKRLYELYENILAFFAFHPEG
jgi:uncharacterized protein (TIGR02266 family)